MDSLVGWNDGIPALGIEKPAAGERVTVTPGVDQGIDISAIAALDAQFFQSGANLWVVFEDGAIIVVEGFFDGVTEDVDGTPRSVIVDGETFTAEEVLVALSIGELPEEFAEGETGAPNQQQNGVSFDDPAAADLPPGPDGIGLLGNDNLALNALNVNAQNANLEDTEPTIGVIANIENGSIDESDTSDVSVQDGILDAPLTTGRRSLAVDFRANDEDAGTDGNIQDAPTGPNSGNRFIIFQSANVGTDPALLPPGLQSGGQTVEFMLSEGDTVLTAYAGAGRNPDDRVFEVKLFDDDNLDGSGNPDGTAGSYEFTLFRPLDHPVADSDDDIILTFNFLANDSDNDSATASFSVTVNDDLPDTDGVAEIAINEDDIVTFNSIGTSPHGQGQDDPGGNDDDSFTPFPSLGLLFDALGPAVAIGTLDDVANFGSDGPAVDQPYAFTDDAAATMDGLGLLSRQDNVVFQEFALDGSWVALLGYVNRGGEEDFELIVDRPVIGLVLDTQTGQYAILQFDQMDHIDNGNNDENTDLLVDTQINDQAGGSIESIDFGAVLKITDGDGDSKELDGALLVTVIDDIPQIIGATASGTVSVDESFADENGNPDKDNLPDPNPFNPVNLVPLLFAGIFNRAIDPDLDTPYLGNDLYAWDSVVTFLPFSGADDSGIPGVPGLGDVDVRLELAVDHGTSSGLFTTEGREIFLYTHEDFLGQDFIVGRLGDFFFNQPNDNGPIAFALYIDDFGNISVMQTISLQHGDSDDADDALNLTGLINAVISVTDEDGDTVTTDPIAIGANIVFHDDGPEVVAEVHRTIDEDDILTGDIGIPGANAGSNGTEPNDGQGDGSYTNDEDDGQDQGPARIFGNLSDLVDFGADGARNNDAFTFISENDQNGQSGVRSLLGALGLSSKGDDLVYDVDQVTRVFGLESQVLFGFVDRGNNDQNFSDSQGNRDRLVFRFELFEDGSYEFQQFDQLDHVDAKGENTDLKNDTGGTVDKVDFGKIIKATDGDGDSVTLDGKFTIEFTDDVANPTLSLLENDTLSIDETPGHTTDPSANNSQSFDNVPAGRTVNGTAISAIFAPVTTQASDAGMGGQVQYATDDNLIEIDVNVGADEETSDIAYSLQLDPNATVQNGGGVESNLTTVGRSDVGDVPIVLFEEVYNEQTYIVGRFDINNGDVDGNDPAAFAIHIDSETGQLSIAQFWSVQNPNSGSPDDSVFLDAGLVQAVAAVTDFDLDTIESPPLDIGPVIEFEDDGPIASDDTFDVDEGTSADVTGNLISNDSVGADDPGTIKQVVQGTSTYAIDENTGFVEFQTEAGGNLKVYANGDYEYTAPASFDHSVKTIADDFDSGYSGGAGWTGAWFETFEGGTNPSAGDIQIVTDPLDSSNSVLRLGDSDQGTDFIDRRFSLDGAVTASLSFDFLRESIENTGGDPDEVRVWISSDGGSNWQVIYEFSGGDDSAYQNETIDISAFISDDMILSFGPRGNLGGNEFIYIDNVEIAYTEAAPTEEFQYTLVDADGDESIGSLSVTINDVGPSVSNAVDGTVDERALAAGTSPDDDTESTMGDLNIDWGADSTDNGSDGSVQDTPEEAGDRYVVFDQDKTVTPPQLTSGGVNIEYSYSDGGTVLTAKAAGDTVFTVTLSDDGVGKYTYTAEKALDHPEQNGRGEELFLAFHFKAVDADGTEVESSFNVKTTDDSPVAVADTGTETDQGVSVTVDVLDNDDFGADGPETTVAQRIVIGTEANGNAEVQADGTVVFTPTPGYSGSGAFFEYAIKDADGDTSAFVTVPVQVNTVAVPPTLALNQIGELFDDFSEQSYDNSFGVTPWTTSWVEGRDGNSQSPTDGGIRIGGNSEALVFRGSNGGPNNDEDYVYRVADLTGAKNARLSFTIDESVNENAETLQLWIGTNGPNSNTGWTLVETFTQNTNSASIDIPIQQYVSANTTFWFQSKDDMGSGEFFRIDDIKIEYSIDADNNENRWVKGDDPVGITAPIGATITDAGDLIAKATFVLDNPQNGDQLVVLDSSGNPTTTLPGGITVSSASTATTVILEASPAIDPAAFAEAMSAVKFTNTLNSNLSLVERTVKVTVEDDGGAVSDEAEATIDVHLVADPDQEHLDLAPAITSRNDAGVVAVDINSSDQTTVFPAIVADVNAKGPYFIQVLAQGDYGQNNEWVEVIVDGNSLGFFRSAGSNGATVDTSSVPGSLVVDVEGNTTDAFGDTSRAFNVTIQITEAFYQTIAQDGLIQISLDNTSSVGAFNATDFFGYRIVTGDDNNLVNDPIILDLDGDGAETITGPVAFDMDADGDADQIGWVAPDDGLLVVDSDGSGKIEDGSEVFSEVFEGGSYANSLEALRSLDSNGDGKIDAQDARFTEIKVWKDGNSDGKTDNGELKTLDEQGIVSLDLDAKDANTDDNGNLVFAEGDFTKSDGSSGSYVGVIFGSKANETDQAGPDELVVATDGVADLIVLEGLSSTTVVENFDTDEDQIDLSALLDGVATITAVSNGTDTTVSIDPDGDGGAAAKDIAVLTGVSGGSLAVVDDGAQASVEITVSAA